MENFCRKMTISCYLMFQILGARLGPVREDRTCVILDIFNVIWQNLDTRNSRTPIYPQIESNSMKLKILLRQATSPYVCCVCLLVWDVVRAVNEDFSLKLWKARIYRFAAMRLLGAGCEWPGWGQVLVTANGRHPESRTILQRMSSQWGGKH